MKSLKYLLTLLMLLAIIAIVLILRNHKSTIPAAIKNVSVGNTGEINRITIRSGTNLVMLARENGDWRLNNAFRVKKTAIDLVLNMLPRMEIVAPVPRNYQAIAAKKLENNGKHVQMYSGNHLLRSFFIGYDTSESQGSLYMKEGSQTPFFLKLKGYSLSDISLLFSPQVRFWRDNTLFNFQPSDISVIQIEYPMNQSQSFEIKILSENQPELIKTMTSEKMKDSDNKSILQYLYYFSSVEYHLPDNDSLPAIDENLLFAEIRITDISNTPVLVKLYKKVLKINHSNAQHDVLNWCYGRISDEEQIISIKYVNIDPILKELDDFLK